MIAGTLFSGGGGVELGVAPFVESFAFGVEYDEKIAAHASHALGHPVTCADVRDVDYRQWRGIDYLHASPPCTRASRANAKAGEDPLDMALVEATLRAVAQTDCRIFTAENVGQWQSFAAFRKLCVGLEALDFRYSWDEYDAADFGVPQHRDRLLLRAWRGNRPLPFVVPTHGSPKDAEADRLQMKLFSDRDALLSWVGWYAAVEDILPTCPDKPLAEWAVRRLDGVTIEPPLLVGNGGYKGKIETRQCSEPSLTISTKQTGSCRIVLPSRVVSLTPRCLARLQSFPDSYELPASKTLATKIIGNSVPPLMARAVFGTILGAS